MTIDPYVPLNVEFEGCVDGGAKLYWRAHGADDSLIEVGIRPSDGRIESVTVTAVAAGRVSRAAVCAGAEMNRPGEVPYVDLALWPPGQRDYAASLVDEECVVSLLIGDSGAALWLTAERRLDSWVVAGQVRFGVAGAQICCLEVCGLSSEQLVDLEQSALGS